MSSRTQLQEITSRVYLWRHTPSGVVTFCPTRSVQQGLTWPSCLGLAHLMAIQRGGRSPCPISQSCRRISYSGKGESFPAAARSALWIQTNVRAHLATKHPQLPHLPQWNLTSARTDPGLMPRSFGLETIRITRGDRPIANSQMTHMYTEYTVELSRKSGGELKTLKAKVIFVLMDPHRQSPHPPERQASPPRRRIPPPSERPPPGSTAPPAYTTHDLPPDYTEHSLSKRLGWLPFVPMGRRETNW